MFKAKQAQICDLLTGDGYKKKIFQEFWTVFSYFFVYLSLESELYDVVRRILKNK